MRHRRSRVPGMLRSPKLRLYRMNSGGAGRKLWIKGAIRHPGALRRKLQRGYVRGQKLRPGQLISETLLERAYAVARRKGDTQTMRQIALARRLKGFSRAKAKGRARTARYGSTRGRMAANPKRWTVKWRP